MVCESFVNVLDLQCVFVNTFAGTWTLFVGIFAFVYLLLAAWLRIPIGAIGAGFLLMGVVLANWQPWVFYVGLIFGGIGIAISIAQAIKR